MNKVINIALLLFVFEFIFVMFIFEDIPIDTRDGETWENIDLGRTTPYLTSLKYLFPRKIIGTVFISDQLTQRTLYPVIFRFIYQLSGLEPYLYYIIKGLALVIVSLLIFYFIYSYTRSLLFSVVANIFYFLLPPVFHDIMWINDLWIFQILFGLSLITILVYYINNYDSLSFKKKLFILCSILLLFLLSRRVKETALFMLPSIFCSFLFLKRNEILRHIPFYIILLIITLPIPINQGAPISLNSFLALTWKNPTPSYGPEITPALLSPIPHFTLLPSSIASTFGFYFGWMIILSLFYLSYVKFICKRRLQFDLNNTLRIMLFMISVLVLIEFFMLFKYGAYTDNPRILIGILTTFTLFAFVVIFETYSSIQKQKAKNLFLVIFLIIIIFTLSINFYYIFIKLRGGLGGLWIASDSISRQVYQDIFNKTFLDEKDIDKLMYARALVSSIPENVLIVSDIMLQINNYELNDISIQLIKEKLKSNKTTLYIVTMRQNILEKIAADKDINHMTVKKLSTISSCTKSMYCKIKKTVYSFAGRKKEYEYIIIKISND